MSFDPSLINVAAISELNALLKRGIGLHDRRRTALQRNVKAGHKDLRQTGKISTSVLFRSRRKYEDRHEPLAAERA